MHMDEDTSFCQQLADKSGSKNVRVLSDDGLPPATLRRLMSSADFMIGFRLHSAIVATSGLTPSITYYYVDKGRVYFDQLKASDLAHPIEVLLEDDFMDQYSLSLAALQKDLPKTRASLKPAIESLRKDVTNAFEQLNSQ